VVQYLIVLYVTPVQIQINVCGVCECNFKLSKYVCKQEAKKKRKTLQRATQHRADFNLYNGVGEEGR
jgi:hypothetical protein